jgi:parallel beta-helix repeat protein
MMTANVKKLVPTVTFAVILLTLAVTMVSANITNINTSKTFGTIQAAIDDAQTLNGHTIVVDPGTYTENVVVDKQLTIQSTSGNPADTIVQAANSSLDVFHVTANYVTISGFTLTNATGYGLGEPGPIEDYGGYGKAGIYLHGVTNCMISNNNVTVNARGIKLNASSYNLISNNTAPNNDDGIYLIDSEYNILMNNTVDSNIYSGITLENWIGSTRYNTVVNNTVSNISGGGAGISLESASNNNLTSNLLISNYAHGIELRGSNNNSITSNDFVEDGLYVWDSYDNTVSDNTINGKPLVYLEAEFDQQVTDAGQVILINCDNITVANLDLSNASPGIELWNTGNSTIDNITVANGYYGIYLGYSNFNTISNNTATSNPGGSIELRDSSYNNLTGNNFSGPGGGIRLIGGSYNKLTSNTVSNAGLMGIYLYDTSSNDLKYNNVSNSNTGIELQYSNSNTFVGNNLINNTGGIYLQYSPCDNNTFTDTTVSCTWAFISREYLHNNRVEWLKISSIPTTISFTYDNGISIKGVNTAPAPDPSGKQNIGKYVNIVNTTEGAWVDLQVHYNEEDDLNGVNESTLFLWKYNNVTGWTMVTSSGNDVAENLVLANISSFSIFAPMGDATTVHNRNTGENFYAIQDAIDDSDTVDGNIIEVDPGTYTENLVVSKQLTIKSTSGNPEDTIVQTTGVYGAGIFTVTANWVNISGFTVTGATGYNYAGIYLDGVTNCNISNNNVSNNNMGICLSDSNYNTITNNVALDTTNTQSSGITLYSSSNNNSITNNIASSGDNYGILLMYSDDNILIDNTLLDNTRDGIVFDYSSNNRIMSNNVSHNGATGIRLDYSSNNTVTSNDVSYNNGAGIYLYRSNYTDIINNEASYNSNTGISVSGSTDNTITGNNASNNSYIGIDLYLSSNNNNLTGNTADSNIHGGIYLDSSSNNTLTGNTANSSTSGKGIFLLSSDNNTLIGNTASNNNQTGIGLTNSNYSGLTSNILSNNQHGFELLHSNHNTLTDNTASTNNKYGIDLDQCNNSTVTNNTFSNNGDGFTGNGIRLWRSNSSTLTGNTVSNNFEYGIYAYSSVENLIYDNYFNNTNNAYDDGTNIWNLTEKTEGINIIGGYYLGGNYWVDYTGVDEDGDVLGDTLLPYNCSGNIATGGDYLPLAVPVATITSPRETAQCPHGPIDIMGYAWDPVNFDHYTLEYREFGNETTWTEIFNGTSPVVNGLLYSWDISALNCSNYRIRLRTFDSAGNMAEDEISIFAVGCTIAGEISDTIKTQAASTVPFTPSTGHLQPKVAYIPVTYPDASYPQMESIATLQDRANLVRDYYFNQSHSKITLENYWIYPDWRPLSRSRADYTASEDIINDAIQMAIAEEGFNVADYDAIVVLQPDWSIGSYNVWGTSLVLTSDQRSYATWAHELGHAIFKFLDHYEAPGYVMSHGNIEYWGLMGKGTLINPPPMIMTWHQVENAGWISGYQEYTVGKSGATVPVPLLTSMTGTQKAPVYKYYTSKGKAFYYYLEGRSPRDSILSDVLGHISAFDWCNYSSYSLTPSSRGVELYIRDKNTGKIYTIPSNVTTVYPDAWNMMTLVPGSGSGAEYIDALNQVKFTINPPGDTVTISKWTGSSTLVWGYSEIGSVTQHVGEALPTQWDADVDLHVTTTEGTSGMNYTTMTLDMPVSGSLTSGNIPGGGTEWFYFPGGADISGAEMSTEPLEQYAQGLGILPPPVTSELSVVELVEGVPVQKDDTEPPEITISSPVQGGVYYAPVTLSYTVTDNMDSNPTSTPASGSTTYSEEGVHTVTVLANDSSGNYASKTISFEIRYRPLVIENISMPTSPVAVNTPITVSVSFTGGISQDPVWDWDDGNTSTGTVTPPTSESPGTVSGTHTYAAAGVYTVTLNYGESFSATLPDYIVVYDPSAGFVTGGGWITSPAGAYMPNPDLTGKANFGFVSKYKKGASAPTGETEFQFKVANLNFHSDSYQWLVIAGQKAMYKGTGTINNVGNYGFLLSAIDGNSKKSNDPDKFRIKIWDNAGIVYDNQMGAAEDVDPATVIGGGSIVIQK